MNTNTETPTFASTALGLLSEAVYAHVNLLEMNFASSSGMMNLHLKAMRAIAELSDFVKWSPEYALGSEGMKVERLIKVVHTLTETNDDPEDAVNLINLSLSTNKDGIVWNLG